MSIKDYYNKTNKPVTHLLTVLAFSVILLLSCCLPGCGSEKKTGNIDTSKAGTVTEETADTVTVIDQAGREVTVPKEVKSIAISYRVAARFIISLGEGEKIKGIGKTEAFLYVLVPSLKEAQDVGKGVPDLEAIAQLKPDVFFHRASDLDGLENVESLGIAAVGVSFETPEEMKTALTIMGAALGKSERAVELIEYYDKKIVADRAEADQITDKKTAIVMGSSVGKVANGGMLQSEMIELAGGINPAADLQASELWPLAGTEQIFMWDPDFIFVTGSEEADYTPEDLYSDSAWSQLKAVKNHHIYRIPAGKDSWEFPGVVTVLGIDYMKSRMYPDRMSSDELQEEVDAFYELSYGKAFTSEEIEYEIR